MKYLSIPMFIVLSGGYLFFNNLIIIMAAISSLIFIGGLRLCPPENLSGKIYLSLSLLMSFILILKIGDSSLFFYILASGIFFLFPYKNNKISIDFLMELIIFIFISIAYYFLLIFFVFNEGLALAPDYNNVLSSYSVIPYFLIFLISNRKRAFWFGIFINLFLILSFSKTGWLLLAGNLIFSFLYLKSRMKIYLVIVFALLVSLLFDKMNEVFIQKMKLSGYGENHGHFYDRLNIYEIVFDYLINKASFSELLFGFNFISTNSKSLEIYFKNSGFFHSAYLEIITISGVLGLILYMLMQMIIVSIVSAAINNIKATSIAYIGYCLFVLGISSSIMLRYPLFFILPILCIEVIRLRHTERKF